MIISLAANKNWPIRQLNIPTAFLNGKVDKNIYIRAPPGVEGPYLKLSRALYGLREYPKYWNQRFNAFAMKYNFKRSWHDFCLYTRNKAIMLIYADDILVTGEVIEPIVNLLHQEFQAKDLGQVNKFIGLQIERSSQGYTLCQKDIINKLITKFEMQNATPKRTPMEVNLKIKSDEGPEVNIPY